MERGRVVSTRNWKEDTINHKYFAREDAFCGNVYKTFTAKHEEIMRANGSVVRLETKF